ncbi:MAG TPA: prepilin-type N-terminal cleavage/methylation domain-containing protein [Candidatus Pacearchaeota archaeon]|nr:prepilin-type N-terminal cleavage/methylation domain-containing protein [Candidatus Pacearchaeota archaeon]
MNNKSFTLIELLVVIVIIGILAGVIMISTSSSIDKANFAKAQTFSNTVQEELLLNLVSEWTFDEPEGAGRITKDSWGSNNGIVVGAAQVNDCVYGKCYSFDQIGENVNCGNNTNLNIKNEATFSFWVKPGVQTSNFDRIIEKGDWKIGGYSIQQRNVGYNEIMFLFASIDGWAGHFAPVVKYIPNQWNYIVVTIGLNSVGKSYLNGNIVGSPTPALPYISVNNDFTIGRASCVINGLIDDIRIYNAALSTSEIKQNYIAGLNSMLSNGNISNEEYNERINELAYDK